MEKRVIVKSKLKEWLESPVATIVIEAIDRKLNEAYLSRANHLVFGEAQKTQEIRAMHLGEESAFGLISDLLQLNPDALDECFTQQNIEIIQTQEEVELESDE